tara:strand:- start:237 stop:512 length:276 start_codon:yes stop_codon:yes gene_type:complete
MRKPSTYSKILKIQREQLDRHEAELRYIAANVEDILNQLNRKVVEENAAIDFDKDPLDQVFRGSHIEWAVSKIVGKGLKAEDAPAYRDIAV